jgi:cation:H+ antiporter
MILGMSAVVLPLTVARQLVRLDVPIMIGVSTLMVLFALDGHVGRSDGVILMFGSLFYTGFLVYQGRKESAALADGPPTDLAVSPLPVHTRVLVNVGWVLLGLVMLMAGSRLLVYGAVIVAEALGVSQLIIGLTIVAAGTSMPELATSIVASYRGEQDIAVGNVVGSNIFNVLLVLGATATVGGVSVDTAVLHFDLPVMIAVAIACLPIFYTGNRISRWEGLLFVGYYVAYSAYLIFDAVGHDQIGLFSNVMLIFVIPLTVVTLITVMWQHPKTVKPLITLKSIPLGRKLSKSQSYQSPIELDSPDRKDIEADSQSPPAK